MESIRHVAVLLIAAGVAVSGAHWGVCSHELFMVASAIVAGEFGLARGAGRPDRNVTIRDDRAPPTS
jgi:hypothetical protein